MFEGSHEDNQEQSEHYKTFNSARTIETVNNVKAASGFEDSKSY